MRRRRMTTMLEARPGNAAMLEVSDLNVRYGAIEALRGVSLRVRKASSLR